MSGGADKARDVATVAACASASGGVVCVVTTSGELAGPSPSFRAFTGQEGAFAEILHPQDRDGLLAALGGAADFERECRVSRPGGRFTRTRARGVRSNDLWIISFAEVWLDESVRRSEERLRLATEAARVAVWEYDFLAGQMTRTDNHDALYGIPRLQVWTYDVFTNATHPDDREMANATVQRSVAPGGPDDYAFDFRVVWPDGSVHWLAVSGNVVRRDEEGRGILVRGALIDVTRLKAVEAELREAVRVRDEFVQVAGHELRTPLTALLLKLDRLQRRSAGLDASAQADVEVARRQSWRLARLVNDLLDVTRLSHGRMELTRTRFRLLDAVEQVLEQLAVDLKRSGCSVSVSGDGGLEGEWDRTRVEQVVENLVVNALKYAPGRPVEITIERAVGEARLIVRDHGSGIAPADLPRIFDKFERGAAQPQGGGLGLGLYIVRQVVESHGGHVGVQSATDGTTFTVTLPM